MSERTTHHLFHLLLDLLTAAVVGLVVAGLDGPTWACVGFAFLTYFAQLPMRPK